MTHIQPDFERPYIEQGKYEELSEAIYKQNFERIWVEFTDELEVEKAIYQYDPENLLRDIIHMVALNRAKKKEPMESYAAITDMVNDMVAMIANRETVNHMERR